MEIWKDVIGYEGVYEISNFGRVRKIVSTNINRSGYPYVNFISKGYKQKPRTIHSLVMEYFVGNRPEGYDIDHIDGNKINNYVDNLEYVTTKENMHRASINNLMAKGSAHGKTKLKEEDVINIRNLHSSGNVKYIDISKIYNISAHQASEIIRRKVWKHV